MTSKEKGEARVLGLFGLAMINIVAIASLRDLPQMATYGVGSIFFYVVAAAVFFLPVSLIAAELATAWPERGGVYVWIREAFGARWGFVAVFLQWFQNLCWFPVVLTFGAASLAFAFWPERSVALSEDRGFIVTVILASYWSAVALNLRGLSGSARISVLGAFSGVVIPGVVLIGLAGLLLLEGGESHLLSNGDRFVPDLTHSGNITFAVSVLLAFAGMEMTAAHAREVRDPARTYPLGILLAAVVILIVFILGALSIAVALAPDQYRLQSGVTEALRAMLGRYGLGEWARLISFGMAVGVFGSVNAWIVGPSKGILAAAEDGALPPWLCQTNRHGVPSRILGLQGVVVSLICLAFTLQPTVASAYFMISVLTIQMYLLMYMMLFVAAVSLRSSHPSRPRPFRVPGGTVGLWLASLLGMTGAVVALTVGFAPPEQLADTGLRPDAFVRFLGVGLASSVVAPLVLFACRKPGWKVSPDR
jgi:putative glutamate/gamma-aminobutyrate antiporter